MLYKQNELRITRGLNVRMFLAAAQLIFSAVVLAPLILGAFLTLQRLFKFFFVTLLMSVQAKLIFEAKSDFKPAFWQIAAPCALMSVVM